MPGDYDPDSGQPWTVTASPIFCAICTAGLWTGAMP
jgi:hypothetical protein